MNLNMISDAQLLSSTKDLAQSEREVLIKILNHLREIARRKLFCDLGYSSLFEYAVKELRYSEGQAGRRIQAIRLLKEIPAVEKHIASGELSLSNVAQAQSLFVNIAKKQPEKTMPKEQKIAVLNTLKNKSTREGQRELLKFQPSIGNSRTFEKERAVTETASEVRFLMTDKLKANLEEVRALLGPKAATMGYAELFAEMAELSMQKLAEKKFGKKRATTPAPERESGAAAGTAKANVKAKAESASGNSAHSISKNARYIPKAVQQVVWRRDGNRCKNCGGRRNLNIDHIRPVACGGTSVVDNLRLLCFSCNQREAMKVFGVGYMAAQSQSNQRDRVL